MTVAPDRPIWGIHMPHELGLAPVERGFVAIGWPGMGDLAALPVTRDAFKQRLAQTHPDMKPGAIPGGAGVLFRFACEMQPGDVVVFPSKPDSMVNIGVLDGPYRHAPGDHAEFSHRRAVRWMRAIPRSSFSQAARYEIGSAITMFRVANNAEEFLAALAGDVFEPAAPDGVSVEQAASQVEESTEDFIINRLKSGQTPYQFEHFVAHLLKCMGYHARVTPASGDGGIDIIAHRDELGFEPPIIKVQCKQTLTTIERPEVQQLHGAVDAKEHGLFVTLGSFSAGARVFERSKPDVRLIDRVALIELILAHYEKFDPRYQTLIPLKRSFVPAAVGG